jgi:phosphopantothenoylcysteine decarboxylase/phosphopantothenate--cysteine ligase
MRVLITAGPTREPIDPVRFLSNRSSGKMGYALAKAAVAAGHRVTLVSGPVHQPVPRGVRLIPVETARQMRAATLKETRDASLVIMAAAVADYMPATPTRQKIKKNRGLLLLRLKRTPDILAELGKRKPSGQVLVGFAAETSRLLEYARGKLAAKNLDYIVANRVGIPGSGFDSDYNTAVLIGRDGAICRFPRMSKIRLARRLMRRFTMVQR